MWGKAGHVKLYCTLVLCALLNRRRRKRKPPFFQQEEEKEKTSLFTVRVKQVPRFKSPTPTPTTPSITPPSVQDPLPEP
jgi:hypothetical protein